MTTTSRRTIPQRYTPTQWLLLAGATLAAVLAWQWLWPAQRAIWNPPPPQLQDIQAMQPALPRPAGDWPDWQNLILQMQERPLFMLSRRLPPPPPKEDTPAQSDQWERATLLGTYAAGQVSGAFLLFDGQPQRLVLGQELGGWTLHAVQPDSIELQRRNQKRQLQVQKKDLTQGAAKGGKGQPPSPFAITSQPSR